MKKFILLLWLLVPAMLIQQGVHAQTVNKIEPMLKQSGYEFEKAADNLWVSTVEGKHVKAIKLIVAESEGMTILLSVVAEKQADKLSTLQMKQLLKLTIALDKVKIGLDEEDNLMVRIDITTRTIDQDELTQALDQLGAAADETHAIILKK